MVDSEQPNEITQNSPLIGRIRHATPARPRPTEATRLMHIAASASARLMADGGIEELPSRALARPRSSRDGY
jgi:hypothetical protein